MLDAEPQPPDVQLREALYGSGREGDSVVGTNRTRKPVGSEGVFEDRLRVGALRRA